MPHLDFEASDYVLAHMIEGIESQQDWVANDIDVLLEGKAQRLAAGEDVTTWDDQLAALYSHDKELRTAWDDLNSAR